MQQIKNVFFFNLHKIAISLILNEIQIIMKFCTSICTSISAATNASS